MEKREQQYGFFEKQDGILQKQDDFFRKQYEPYLEFSNRKLTLSQSLDDLFYRKLAKK